ncbi:MAG: ThuA domain-containing protein [Planctomycetota bacterium]
MIALGFAVLAVLGQGEAAPPPPAKVLLVTGGVCHDFDAIVPQLTKAIVPLWRLAIDVKVGLAVLNDARFADPYDVVVYDFCFDDADDVRQIDHALAATRAGKPTVMIHCAVHSFRNSERVREWEECCGMRSKAHDPYQAFETRKADASQPILKDWPDCWRTPGDELYQTIELLPAAHALLKASSPVDAREHVVCWTSTYGKGRVFGTTLGHDLNTASQPSYHRLLVNGIRWAMAKSE